MFLSIKWGAPKFLFKIVFGQFANLIGPSNMHTNWNFGSFPIYAFLCENIMLPLWPNYRWEAKKFGQIVTCGKSAHFNNVKCVVRIYLKWKTPLLWKAIFLKLCNRIEYSKAYWSTQRWVTNCLETSSLTKCWLWHHCLLIH